MLYLVGLGLGDAKDITVRGLEIVKKAQRVYLESYTSILTVGKEALVSTIEVCVLEKSIPIAVALCFYSLGRILRKRSYCRG